MIVDPFSKQSSLVSMRERMSSYDARFDEVEVMQSMFPDDFVVLQEITPESLGAFTIRITPHTAEDDNYCSLTLRVEYRKGYPQVIPEFAFMD